VSSFVFYNHSVGPEAARVLQHYSARGLVTVLPWALPVRSQTKVRRGGG
jgi:hypothetical protein